MKKDEAIKFALSVAVSVFLTVSVVAYNVNPSRSMSGNTEDLPVFMYLMTDEDGETGEIRETLKKLEDEYSGKITFDIRNIDKTPSPLKSFPTEGKTPMLVILDGQDDVMNILYETKDYEKLKKAIEDIVNQ